MNLKNTICSYIDNAGMDLMIDRSLERCEKVKEGILRCPSSVINHEILYFFTNENFWVRTGEPEKIEEIIRSNNLNDTLKSIILLCYL